MKRKNGEGSWGTKSIKGVSYFYYRISEGKYYYATTMKELKAKIKKATTTISAKTNTLKAYGMTLYTSGSSCRSLLASIRDEETLVQLIL